MNELFTHDCGHPDDGWRNLRNAIIESAITDYKAMITGVKKQNHEHNIKQIERFFKSGYCGTLLCDTKVTGEDILRELHSFRDEYYDSLAKKKKKGRIRRK